MYLLCMLVTVTAANTFTQWVKFHSHYLGYNLLKGERQSRLFQVGKKHM